jgi:hypothetical protein
VDYPENFWNCSSADAYQKYQSPCEDKTGYSFLSCMDELTRGGSYCTGIFWFLKIQDSNIQKGGIQKLLF